MSKLPGMNRVARTLLKGLAVFLPSAITGWVLWRAFVLLDRILPFHTPGLGFMALLALVFALGLLADNWLAAPLIVRLERLMERLPVVRLLYKSLREMTEALLGERRPFHHPVLVRPWPGSETRLLGFLTRQDLSELGKPGWMAVYVPNAYAIAGQTLIVPAEQVESLDLESSQAMTFAVSAGVTGAKENP
ncbi:MAG: hypothetical protein RL173_1437 [Fibrobacterota bacterium]